MYPKLLLALILRRSHLYQYIRTTLKLEFGLSTERRPKHYLTVPHFKILVKQLWQTDWYQPTHKRITVYDHGFYLMAIYSSGRLGEMVESTMRRKSGRGLLFEVITRLNR